MPNNPVGRLPARCGARLCGLSPCGRPLRGRRVPTRRGGRRLPNDPNARCPRYTRNGGRPAPRRRGRAAGGGRAAPGGAGSPVAGGASAAGRVEWPVAGGARSPAQDVLRARANRRQHSSQKRSASRQRDGRRQPHASRLQHARRPPRASLRQRAHRPKPLRPRCSAKRTARSGRNATAAEASEGQTTSARSEKRPNYPRTSRRETRRLSAESAYPDNLPYRLHAIRTCTQVCTQYKGVQAHTFCTSPHLFNERARPTPRARAPSDGRAPYPQRNALSRDPPA